MFHRNKVHSYVSPINKCFGGTARLLLWALKVFLHSQLIHFWEHWDPCRAVRNSIQTEESKVPWEYQKVKATGKVMVETWKFHDCLEKADIFDITYLEPIDSRWPTNKSDAIVSFFRVESHDQCLIAGIWTCGLTLGLAGGTQTFFLQRRHLNWTIIPLRAEL